MPSMTPYSLQMVQEKQGTTNFYDVGNPGVGELALRAVTARQYGSDVRLTDYLGTALAATPNMGYTRRQP